MTRMFSSTRTLLVGAFVAAAAVGQNQSAAQEPETARIVTADGVRLNAVFYPSKKRNAPTVLMLHPVGEGKSIKSQDWKSLAESLQKNEFAVLMFDFRGHGESTTIDQPDTFWNLAVNRNYVRAKSKDTIDVKDFIKSTAYAPVLVNDIAAVKAYLDRKNDLGACNTGNTIVIGADNGGTIGALWINSEWNRFKYTKNMFNQVTVDKRAEGNDIIGAVFLSIQPKIVPGRTVSITGLLKRACKDHGMPAAFFCGKEDTDARKLGNTLTSNLKVKNSKRHDFIGPVELDTNLSGVSLLQKGLKTDSLIARWLDAVVEDRKNEWLERNFQDTLYMWRPSFGQPWPAHRKGDRNLVFDSYDRFISQ